MEYISIGKYVNTHGIKGEIRILSDFSRKDLIFIPTKKIYIGDKRDEYTINTYRKHKNYDMVTLKGIDNINDIEMLKGSIVYIDKDDLNEEFLIEDLIDYVAVIENEEFGIKEILNGKNNPIIVLNNNSMIPYVDEFIIKIDSNEKKIYIKYMKGLII